QNTCLFPIRLERAKECLLKKSRIEERRIILPRQRAIPRMRGPCGNRNLLRDLETPSKRFRCLLEKLCPECIRGELIEREVAANCRKYRGIFAQASLFEQLFRKAPAHLIARWRIDLPQPAFVLP